MLRAITPALRETGSGGLAICHCGGDTEAGTGACFVKFAAARPGLHADVEKL